MAAPAYEQLLVVQELDTTIDQRKHRIAHHPIQAEIAEIDEQVKAVAATVSEVEERRHELQRSLNRLTDEVALIDDKRSQIDAKLYDGSVTATKDLLALQDEAKMLLDRKTGIEDDELEIMESVEQVDAELAPSVARREELAAERDRLEAALAADIAEIEADLASVEGTRSDAAEAVPADLLSHYERLRVDFGGVAVAKLVGSTCDGVPHDALRSCHRRDQEATRRCGRHLRRLWPAPHTVDRRAARWRLAPSRSGGRARVDLVCRCCPDPRRRSVS